MRHGIIDVEWSPVPVEFDPQRFKALIKGHGLSTPFRWWKAFLDPSYSKTSAQGEMYIREEQEVDPQSRIIVHGTHFSRRLFPHGELRDGDISVTFDPVETPIANNDWVQPVGDYKTLLPSPPTEREGFQREVVVRGDQKTALNGTVSSSGSTATFSIAQNLKAGDTILCVGQPRVISAVVSATVYTLNSAPSPAWNGNNAARVSERLILAPVTFVEDVRSAGTVYRQGVDFDASNDGTTIAWLSGGNSPAVGERLSVSYYYRPVFMANSDLGHKRVVVAGNPLPSTIVCRLVANKDYSTSG